MDAKQVALEEKLIHLLKQAAEVGAIIRVIEQGLDVYHYDQIESHAQQCAQRLSQIMQQTKTADVGAEENRKSPVRSAPIESHENNLPAIALR